MYKVSLLNNTEYPCQESQTVLDAAKKANVVLEHSCRTGRCGMCKAEVLSGETELLKAEVGLTAKEVDEGFILTCCRSTKSDIAINVEDLAELANYPTKTIPCRIDNLKLLAKDVMLVTLRTPPAMPLNYLAGQYIDVIGKDGLRRSYSIANYPNKDRKIRLHIRSLSGGKMSGYWFNDAKVEDVLRLEGPLGTFCYRHTKKKNIVFLATGTGIAPIKAILEQFDHEDHFKNYSVSVYWGGRKKEDFYDEKVLNGSGYKFIPVLSRGGHDWQGATGYVQDVAIGDGHDWDQTVVYACGSPVMIESAKLTLQSYGLSVKSFYSDAFLSSSCEEREII